MSRKVALENWIFAGVEQMHKAKVVSVSDVLAEASSRTHGNCSKAVLHQVPDSETSLFSVNPGEKLAPHLHTRIWDLFFVVSGLGEIRYKGECGADTVPMPARAFCAIPPGYEHEVCNLSATEPFSFLLIHAPWKGYDRIRTIKPSAPNQMSLEGQKPTLRERAALERSGLDAPSARRLPLS
jgi:mannose-6-phosphate isomerase-like protein (cupin superfamily)